VLLFTEPGLAGGREFGGTARSHGRLPHDAIATRWNCVHFDVRASRTLEQGDF
jgi:hypothetical protein